MRSKKIAARKVKLAKQKKTLDDLKREIQQLGGSADEINEIANAKETLNTLRNERKIAEAKAKQENEQKELLEL